MDYNAYHRRCKVNQFENKYYLSKPSRFSLTLSTLNLVIKFRQFLFQSIQDYRIKLALRDWGRILLRLTPAGSACWNRYMSRQTDTFHMFSWCKPKVLFLWQMSSYFVSFDSYQHRRLSHFVIDVLKMNLCQLSFSLNCTTSLNKYRSKSWD